MSDNLALARDFGRFVPWRVRQALRPIAFSAGICAFRQGILNRRVFRSAPHRNVSKIVSVYPCTSKSNRRLSCPDFAVKKSDRKATEKRQKVVPLDVLQGEATRV